MIGGVKLHWRVIEAVRPLLLSNLPDCWKMSLCQ